MNEENKSLPLSDLERAELNAYRAKAQQECDQYYQQMRGLMNHTPPMSVAEMQKAINVNLHAREIPSGDDEVIGTPGHDLTKLILRQATYFLLLMLAVGVGLAVFL